MKLTTIAKRVIDNSVILNSINVDIKADVYDRNIMAKSVKLVGSNVDYASKTSLINAVILFIIKLNPSDSIPIEISIESEKPYSGNYLTSLVYYALCCWKFKLMPYSKIVIVGDLLSDGTSTNETFNITSEFHAKYPNYDLLLNKSASELYELAAVQKIQRWYRNCRNKKILFEENFVIYV